MPKFTISPLQSDLLDLSRWLAAFLVVSEHLRSLLVANNGTNTQIGTSAKIFYFMTGFGHCAVMIFFVMSGFLVGGKVIDLMVRGEFSWKKYGVDRVSRLYAVFLLALFLGGVLDYFGHLYFNHYGLYDQTFNGRIAAIDHNIIETLNFRVLAVNVFMCQTILGPVFGSNGPLWSLANEAWYYLAGPILFLAVFARKTGSRMLAIVGLAVIIWFLPPWILLYGLMWLWGASLVFINHRRLLPVWISLPMFLVSMLAARLAWIHSTVDTDFLMAITFGLFINSVSGGSRRLPVHNLSRLAADFSYSVYLCHFPLSVFLASILFQEGWIGFRELPTPKLVFVYVLVLMLAYLWCFGVSLITERQTHRIRAWFNQRFA